MPNSYGLKLAANAMIHALASGDGERTSHAQ
jgi:hypothetical protein